MSEFTDEELLAYIEERLALDRSAAVEHSLRQGGEVATRLVTLLSQMDQGERSVGDIWRRERLTCPPRAVWAAYVEHRLGDGLSSYLRFHVETVGCRTCAANLADLQLPGSADDADRRAKKIFQSSAGRFRPE